VKAVGVGFKKASNKAAAHLVHVDGLRAVAVISVLVYHLPNGPDILPGGYLGVDIFL
jgi:peptidoglycan/LPS O-acetylase OafA/YrhL